MTQSSIGSKARRASIIIFGGGVATKILRYLASIVMARLLFPEDYGLLAMATASAGLIQVLGNMSIPAYIMQDTGEDSSTVHAAFYINLCVLVILAGLQFLAAPIVGSYFNNTDVVSLLRWLSLTYLLSALSDIHQTILKKRLQFKWILAADVSRDLSTSAFRIYFAVAGFGPYSFVFGDLLGYLVRVPILWFGCRFIPHWKEVSKSGIKKVLWFGGHSFYGSLSSFFSRELDKFVLGRVLSSTSLGLYSFARGQAVLPYAYIVIPQNSLSFSLIANSVSDPETLRKRYLMITNMLAFVMVPIYMFLFSSAPKLIVLVFGSKWADAVFPFMLFCLLHLVYSVTTVSNDVLLSLGFPNVRSKISVFELLMMLIVLPLAFIHHNMILTALSVTIVVTVRQIFQLKVTLDHIELPWYQYSQILIRIIAFSIISSLVSLLPSVGNPLVVLVCQIIIFVTTFLVLTLVFARSYLFEVLILILGTSKVQLLPFVQRVFHNELQARRLSA